MTAPKRDGIRHARMSEAEMRIGEAADRLLAAIGWLEMTDGTETLRLQVEAERQRVLKLLRVVGIAR